MPLLLNLSQLPLPASCEDLFGRNGPLVLELGFGDGAFLESLARQYANWNLLGADVARVSVSRAWHRLQAARLTNVRIYGGSGRFLLSDLVEPAALARMYVNFPDPWPKARHADRRLFQADFFPLLASRLAMNGSLYLTTDDERYFECAVSMAQESPFFTVDQPDPPPQVLQTKYARKWRAQSRSYFHAEMRKCAPPVDAIPPAASLVTNMFHALLAGQLPEPDRFEPSAYPFKGGKVVLLQSLWAGDGHKLVIKARTHEPDLTQDVLVEVRPSTASQADLVVNLTSFGQPLATRGAREAVKAVTSWLISHGLTLVETYY